MSLLVVGSVAVDSIETPFGKRDQALGGSATYFSTSASFFTNVNLVAIVGEDFGDEHVQFLRSRGVGLDGLVRAKGKTFHWKGQYGFDLNTANTLATDLNVFATFSPELSPELRRSQHLFLGNIDPDLQWNVLNQIEHPRIVAADTMNFWITGEPKLVGEVLAKIDMLVINDEEARDLTGIHNLVKAAADIRKRGPSRLIIKRGEHGALYFDDAGVFFAPGYPLEDVLDPTGAGDSFAGGLIGYIASVGAVDHNTIRRAIYFGSALGSFCVEGIGPKRLLDVGPKDLAKRMQQFMALVETGGPVTLPE